MPQLASYLEALHQQDLANNQHTTLLINCYTKLKEKEKLHRFIYSDHTGKNGMRMRIHQKHLIKYHSNRTHYLLLPLLFTASSLGFHFDTKTAITVLRKASCFEEALHLSKTPEFYTDHLLMQIEDVHDYEGALTFIHSLSKELASSALQLYGKDLMTVKPVETVELMIELCTPAVDIFTPLSDDDDDDDDENQNEDGNNRAKEGEGRGSVEEIGFSSRSQPAHSSHSFISGQVDAIPRTPREIATRRREDGEYECLPDHFIHCFVDYPLQLKNFLREMVKLREEHDSSFWNTYLELFLRRDLVEQALKESLGDECTEEMIEDVYSKEALEILMNPRYEYDDDQALILVQMYDFKEGKLFLYKKLQMHAMLLKYYMELGDTEKVIDVCKQFGHQDESLWIQLLTFYAEMDDINIPQLLEVLQYINDTKEVPPLMVLQILSRNKQLNLQVIRSFVVQCIREKQELTEKDENEVYELQTSIESMQKEVASVKQYPYSSIYFL